MTQREFRFGVVAGTAADAAGWADTARRAEAIGYDILLVPDTLHTLAPFPALAAAAASTRTLRVGTYVLSAPNRTPGLVAWEAQTMHRLTDGRFELGLGGGRPGADRDATALGGDFGTPADRLRRVAATVAAVRALPAAPTAAGASRPPILIAASRPRMLRLAAEQADIVALGLPPGSDEAELRGRVAALRQHAGDRVDSLELHLNTVAVAASPADLPTGLARLVGGDPRQLAAAGGIAFLIGTPSQIADLLRRRRDELGITYLGVSAMFMAQFAPVLARLRR